jgi:hypothetical protein
MYLLAHFYIPEFSTIVTPVNINLYSVILQNN